MLYKKKNRMALIEFLTIITIKSFDEIATREYGIIKKNLKDRNCLIGPRKQTDFPGLKLTPSRKQASVCGARLIIRRYTNKFYLIINKKKGGPNWAAHAEKHYRKNKNYLTIITLSRRTSRPVAASLTTIM
jgi:hypothetical protein